MGNIKVGIQFIDSPDKDIAEILINFYEEMVKLEKDEYKAGKRAVTIIMTINDIKNLLIKS